METEQIRQRIAAIRAEQPPLPYCYSVKSGTSTKGWRDWKLDSEDIDWLCDTVEELLTPPAPNVVKAHDD